MSKPQAINFTHTHTHTKRRTHTRPYVVRCGRPPKWRQHLRQCSRGNHKLCHSQRQRQRRQVKCLSYKFTPTPFLPSSTCLFFTWPVKNISGSNSSSPKWVYEVCNFRCAACARSIMGCWQCKARKTKEINNERKAAESKHDRKNNGKT